MNISSQSHTYTPHSIPHYAVAEQSVSKQKLAKADNGIPKPKFVPRNLNTQAAFAKMKKNVLKAAEEHRRGSFQLLLDEALQALDGRKPYQNEQAFIDNLIQKIQSQKKNNEASSFCRRILPSVFLTNKENESPYATPKQAIASLEKPLTKSIGFCEIGKADKKGKRPSMEDAHFVIQTDRYAAVGIFDGHGGKKVANYVNDAFKKRLFNKVNELDGNIHAAFEQLCCDIQQEIYQHSQFHMMGSTAVVSLVDKKSGLICTMTIADAESFIIREVDGKLKAIPLSPLRTWASPNDRTRIGAQNGIKPYPGRCAINSEQVFGTKIEAKNMRSHTWYGVNVPRAFGDKYLNINTDQPIISVKPKITINRIVPENKFTSGDILLHCCDGLPDYAEMNEILEQIKKNKHLSSTKMAQHLADWVIQKKEGQDNVTILITKIH